MTDETDKSQKLTEAVVEKPKELVQEASEGRSERTPLIALTGVTIAVGILVAIVLALAFLIYFLV